MVKAVQGVKRRRSIRVSGERTHGATWMEPLCAAPSVYGVKKKSFHYIIISVSVEQIVCYVIDLF